MRREWTRLERGNTEAAWRNSQATFRSQVVGRHFERICRDWAMSVGDEVFGDFPGQVAAATVNDPRDKKQIEIDVAVLAPEETGRPRRILSLGEAKWDRTMTFGHVERLRRARELLSAKGYDTSRTVLTCYSGAGFDQNLRAAGVEPGNAATHTDSPRIPARGFRRPEAPKVSSGVRVDLVDVHRQILLIGDSGEVGAIRGFVSEPRVSRNAHDPLQADRRVVGDRRSPVDDLVDLLAAASQVIGDALLGEAVLIDPLLQVLARSNGVVDRGHGFSCLGGLRRLHGHTSRWLAGRYTPRFWSTIA